MNEGIMAMIGKPCFHHCVNGEEECVGENIDCVHGGWLWEEEGLGGGGKTRYCWNASPIGAHFMFDHVLLYECLLSRTRPIVIRCLKIIVRNYLINITQITTSIFVPLFLTLSICSVSLSIWYLFIVYLWLDPRLRYWLEGIEVGW